METELQSSQNGADLFFSDSLPHIKVYNLSQNVQEDDLQHLQVKALSVYLVVFWSCSQNCGGLQTHDYTRVIVVPVSCQSRMALSFLIRFSYFFVSKPAHSQC